MIDAREKATRGGCDISDMVVVHRVFRREFRLMPAMVRAVSEGDTARAGRIGRHAADLINALQHHDRGEDDVLWPVLGHHAVPDRRLVERMEQQHRRVSALLADVRSGLVRWTSTADPAEAARLAAVLDAVAAAVDEHLADEEQQVLPLAVQHVSALECARMGEHAVATIPRNRTSLFLGHILEQASPAERSTLLARLPRGSRLAYRLVGRRRFRAEVRYLRAGLA